MIDRPSGDEVAAIRFEYAVRECAPKAPIREALLNEMAAEGWEPVELRVGSVWEWSPKDQVTFRRPHLGA
ncbi:hypothetical protein [Aeromicrobium wangtongii]|uniref:hypothetical protein n=1 Tax=Aeromicrobium wangtongii TaxID=2969247 RepID=UPI0020180027|nr:hypothetical protein [Aeromicrobium wangtongii]MCL3817298.1 hypothetical protein [Aeromicrobium wangtongii]